MKSISYKKAKHKIVLFKERNKLKKEDNLYVTIFFGYFFQIFSAMTLLYWLLKVIGNYAEITDYMIYSAIKSFGAKDFLTISLGVIGLALARNANRSLMSILVIHIVCMLSTFVFFMAIPVDLIFSEQAVEVQRLLTFSLVFFFASIVGVPLNIIFILVGLIVNRDPTSKTSAAPTVHDPSGLARDLRLSRSRARRFRVEC